MTKESRRNGEREEDKKKRSRSVIQCKTGDSPAAPSHSRRMRHTRGHFLFLIIIHLVLFADTSVERVEDWKDGKVETEKDGPAKETRGWDTRWDAACFLIRMTAEGDKRADRNRDKQGSNEPLPPRLSRQVPIKIQLAVSWPIWCRLFLLRERKVCGFIYLARYEGDSCVIPRDHARGRADTRNHCVMRLYILENGRPLVILGLFLEQTVSRVLPLFRTAV